MNKANLLKVIENMESGKYTQIHGPLRDGADGYCALAMFAKTFADETGLVEEYTASNSGYTNHSFRLKDLSEDPYGGGYNLILTPMYKWLQHDPTSAPDDIFTFGVFLTVDQSLIDHCVSVNIDDDKIPKLGTKTSITAVNDIYKVPFPGIAERLKREYLSGETNAANP